MNWEAIGAVSELIGAAAVLASLLYLANQIRQSTEVARSVARQGIAETAIAEASSVVDHGDLAELMYRELSGGELEAHENYRLQLFAFRSLRLYENAHYQHRAGMLDADEWAAFRYNLSLLFELSMYDRFWPGHERQFTPVFRELVEELRVELRAAGRLGTAGAEIMGLAPSDQEPENEEPSEDAPPGS